MRRSTDSLPALRDVDEAGFSALNLGGRGRAVVLCDHASNRIPEELDRLGLGEKDLERAIAYDIGASFVAEFLALRLDAPLISSTVSRLVIDCNRPLGTPDSIPVFSEDTTVPGNLDLPQEERDRRAERYFRPYHDRISALLDDRADNGLESWIISIHSFTPVFCGVARPWHVGFSYHRSPALARQLISTHSAVPGLVVGDNQPYPVDTEGDYSIPVHAEARSLPGVLIEIRQDLLASAQETRAWATRIADALASISLESQE